MTKADATNGSFTVSPEKALEGDEITVTATPDEGYAVDTMTYTDSDGKVTDFTSTGKFTMPASDVTVSVTFKAKELTGKWVKNHKGWWYKLTDGSYPTSCFKTIDGKIYHFDSIGYMQTGWQKISGRWYYFAAGGAMQTGWQKISGKWYYFYGNGEMAANKWIGNYYLTGTGAMATNTWIGKYYVGADGKWIPGYKATN